jgi:hypothetical protein
MAPRSISAQMRGFMGGAVTSYELKAMPGMPKIESQLIADSNQQLKRQSDRIYRINRMSAFNFPRKGKLKSQRLRRGLSQLVTWNS